MTAALSRNDLPLGADITVAHRLTTVGDGQSAVATAEPASVSVRDGWGPAAPGAPTRPCRAVSLCHVAHPQR
jgi:hypothetical protein